MINAQEVTATDTAARKNHVKIAQVLGNRCEILNRLWFQALNAENARQKMVRRHAWPIFQLRVVRPGVGLRIHSGSCDVMARLWTMEAMRVGRWLPSAHRAGRLHFGAAGLNRTRITPHVWYCPNRSTVSKDDQRRPSLFVAVVGQA